MRYHACSDVMHALRSTHMQVGWPPLFKHGMPEITYAHAVHAR